MPKTIPLPPPTTGPRIQTRQELDIVLENIAQLHTEHDEITLRLEAEIIALRQRSRAALAEIENFLVVETAWVEAWAETHPDLFSERRSLSCLHATIGFRLSPARVERIGREWDWSKIARQLAELPWGARYLRQPEPELNKEALLADRRELAPEQLREAGLKILQQERFFILPHGELPALAAAA